jgi:hypothetical protein
MEKIRTCRWCRRLYQGISDSFCPECVQKMDDAFVTVRAYLDSHPKANATDITKATGLEEKIVLQLLRDERLQEYTHYTMRCGVCGRAIEEGKFCGGCKKMMEGFARANAPAGEKRREPRESSHRERESSHREQESSHRERETGTDSAAKPFRNIRLYDDD